MPMNLAEKKPTIKNEQEPCDGRCGDKDCNLDVEGQSLNIIRPSQTCEQYISAFKQCGKPTCATYKVCDGFMALCSDCSKRYSDVIGWEKERELKENESSMTPHKPTPGMK